MIIFGFRTMVKLLATVNLVCGNCHNPAAQQVIRRMRWFTLFFVPIFPFSVSRSMTCTFCGVTTKLSKEDADHLAAVPVGAAPGLAQPQPAVPQAPAPQGWPQQSPPPNAGWSQQPPPPNAGWSQQPPPPGDHR